MIYVRLGKESELKDLKDYLKQNILNPVYKHLLGGNYLRNTIDVNQTDCWNCFQFVILNNKKKSIGMIKLSIDRSNCRHNITGIFLKEEYMGKKFGTRALLEVLDIAKSYGLNRIELETSSKRLKDYYLKIGFKNVGTLHKSLKLTNGELVDNYIMEILLK